MKEKLLELEKTGKYLFHGSRVSNLDKLEPRQSYTILKGTYKLVKDGEPAISATPYIEIAIFRAVVKEGRSGFDANTDGILDFRASKEALEFAKNQTGYVYVFNRNDFTPRSEDSSLMEWRSSKAVKPIQVIKVDYNDMPKDIKIIQETRFIKKIN